MFILTSLFKLVIVHGITDSASCQSEVGAFWQARFPNALVTTFRFIQDDVAWGTRGFIECARRLLLEVKSHRKDALDIPCVVLCHELGGCLVQQALVLAARDKTCYDLSLRIALIIFSDTPDFKDEKLRPENYVLHLLSKSDLEPVSPVALMKELPSVLESLSWEYANMSAHYRVQRNETPWTFTPGDDATEAISDTVNRAVGDQLRTRSQSLLEFLLILVWVDTNNHQLRLQKPIVQSKWWSIDSSVYQRWKSLEGSAPNILHIYHIPESTSATLASQLFFEMRDTFENATFVTYSIQKHDLRTQIVESFFVSLIRQILQSRPSLFHRVTSIAEHFLQETVFSHEVLQTILVALLRASINRPVVLILDGGQHSKTALIESLTSLIKEYRKASTGGFKVIILTEGDIVSHLDFASDICCRINTSIDEICTALRPEFLSYKIRSLVRYRPQWQHCSEAINTKLATSQSLVQAGLIVSCLSTCNTVATPGSMERALQVLPSTIKELFSMVVSRCEERSGLDIRSLMQWIIYAVRPLSVAELSVVAALSASEKTSVDALKQDLPVDLAEDLQGLVGDLVEVAGFHILPVYANAGCNLVDDQGATSHSMMLSKCLDYLESIFDCHTTRSDDSEAGNGREAELLEYAVREWPQHYNLASASPTTRDRVLGFLGTDDQVKRWFKYWQNYTDFETETYYELDDGLKVACWFGLLDVAEKAIESTKETEDPSTELTQALDLAAGNGQSNVVDLLLKAGASYNYGLCWASEGGFHDIVTTLLNVSNEAIDKEDKHGRTPFILGALRGNEKIAAYLLEKGGNPSLAAGYSINALHLAAMTGQVAIVQPLIAAKVDVNAVTDGGDDALRLAAAAGFDDIVKLLLPHETDIDEMNNEGRSALHLAVRNGHTSVCELLFQAGASIHKTTSQGFSTLHLAAEQGFVDVVQWLFSRQFRLVDTEVPSTKVNGDDIAFKQEDTSSDGKDEKPDEQDEKSKGDDVDNSGGIGFDDMATVLSPLQLAAQNGNMEVIHELLQHAEYNTEQERSTSLLLAAKVGFIGMVEEILNFGMVTAIQESQGNTALHLAAVEHPNIVSRLLQLEFDGKATFDINAKNKSGWTPLHVAVTSGRYVTILTLLDKGAKMVETADCRRTVFHLAALHGHLFVLKALWNRQKGKHGERQAMYLAQDEDGDTPFTLALSHGHVSIMAAMLEKLSPSPDTASPSTVAKLQGDRKNALIMAIEGGCLEAVELLLSNGWDVNAEEENGDRPLHRATERGDVPIMKLLIEKGTAPNLPGHNGMTPLHYAASNHPDAVKALLDLESTDINVLDDEGTTPLWLASFYGKVSCVELLLQRSPNLNVVDKERDWSALHAAYDNPEITKLLLDAGADTSLGDANGLALLPFVSDQRNGTETVQHYLSAGLDPDIRNASGYTAVHVAADNNLLEIIKILKANGADINATAQQGETALHLSAYRGYHDVLDYLLDCGLDVNQHSTEWGTPIMAAAKGTEPQIVSKLIERGADVNATSQDFNYHTAIQAAAWANSPDTVQALLDGKADVNLVGGEYGSALCAAACVKSRDIAVRILDAGADIDYAEGPLGTALECALSQQSWDVAAVLLERNAAVNIVSKRRRGTALLAAIHGENMDMVQDLLNRGADPNLSANTGEVPAQIAIRKGRDKILEIILDKGGRLSFKDKYGRGAVSTAIVHNSLGLLPHFWGREDIDVNERDAAKRTPLMLAVLQGVNAVQELFKNGAKLDLQDQWGNTALIYSIVRSYQPLAYELIECGASPFIADVRRRDALYWACRQSSWDTFSKVHQEMRKLEAIPGPFQGAINAAVASGQPSMINTLLENIKYSQKQVDDDGWTARHTAVMYEKPELDDIIKAAIVESGQTVVNPLSAVKLPTQWHESDLSMALIRGADTRIITVSKSFEPLRSDPPKALVRADHPMWPQHQNVYYFEITIVNEGDNDKRRFGVGFCDETESLGTMVGWENSSWGYHGDDGKAFHMDSFPFGPMFGQGDVIGCGVNFDKQTAFYTKNGEIIGQAFTDVRGKIYPAISLDIRMTNCEISARFWEDGDIGNKDFVFRGPFNDPKTFQESERSATDRQAKEESESDSNSVSTGTQDSWYSNEE